MPLCWWVFKSWAVLRGGCAALFLCPVQRYIQTLPLNKAPLPGCCLGAYKRKCPSRFPVFRLGFLLIGFAPIIAKPAAAKRAGVRG